MAKNKLPENEKRFCFPAGECVKILGVSDSNINRWNIKPEFADGRKKFYDIRKVVQWYFSTIKKNDQWKDMWDARTRVAKSQAERGELQAAALRGELVSMDKVDELCSDATILFRSEMLSLPGRVIDKILSAANKTQARQALQDEVEKCLLDFSLELENRDNLKIENTNPKSIRAKSKTA